jgi:hypothetical protein
MKFYLLLFNSHAYALEMKNLKQKREDKRKKMGNKIILQNNKNLSTQFCPLKINAFIAPFF